MLGYLHDNDWKISQPGLYKHVKDGKLTPNEAGQYGKIAVDKYARTFLKKKDGSTKFSDELNTLQRDKLIAETRMASARAEHWETKTQADRGELVPRDWAERELAARASVLKSDDDNWIFGAASDIIKAVNGDPTLEPDLIEFLRTSREGIFARYADVTVQFIAPAPASRPEASATGADFDAASDDEEDNVA